MSPRADPVPLCRHEGARVRVRAAAPLPPSAGEVPSAPAPEVPGQVPGHTGAHLWHLLGAVPLCGRGMLAPGFPVLPSVPEEGNDKVSAPQLPVPLCWDWQWVLTGLAAALSRGSLTFKVKPWPG